MTEVWTAEQLMGLVPGESVPNEDGSGKKGTKGKGVEGNPMLWGVPGHLTKAESDVFFKFKDEVEKRGGDFRETVYCFGEQEGECWALCRWLRARKYVIEDVIKMIEEATEVRKPAKAKDFYPNPVDALGVEASLFFALYPQLYTGFAKNGVPLYISKPGKLSVDGMECITTLDGIIQFHWHIMMHDFASRLHKAKESDPDNFKRFECLCVLDLDGLSTSMLNSKTLAIIKEQAAIDSICFPETMNKMLIVNAPTFFSATWRLIKGWLDPRTASKIEVISTRATMEKRLLDLVDADELPSDYGGKSKDTETILNEAVEGDALKVDTKMVYVRAHASESLEVGANESLDITVYTRSTAGAKFAVTDGATKKQICPVVEVKRPEAANESVPTLTKLNATRIQGPASLKVKADSNSGRFSRQDFLLVMSHFKK